MKDTQFLSKIRRPLEKGDSEKLNAIISKYFSNKLIFDTYKKIFGKTFRFDTFEIGKNLLTIIDGEEHEDVLDKEIARLLETAPQPPATEETGE